MSTDIDTADATAAAPSPVIAAPGDARAGRFPCIDGLRAVAALAVVVYHTTTHYNVATSEYANWEWVNRLGNFGVSTFFLISGFLLYRPYVLAHLRGAPTPKLGSFWRRRFLRIFPGYWVAFSAAVVFGFVKLHDLSAWFTGYGLLQNYRFGYQLFGLGVEWTLVIEVSFYLALPFFALVLRSLSAKEATPAQRLRGHLLGLGAMYLIAMGVRIWSLWFLHAPKGQRYGDWFPVAQVTQWLVGYLDWFALGMLLATGSAWVAIGGRLPRLGEQLANHPGVCWLLAAECYWVALDLHLPVSVFSPVTRVQSFGIAFVYGIVAFLLLFPTVFGPQDQGVIRRFLRSRAMFALGTISYGIYLWHLVIVKWVERWTTNGWVTDNLFVWLGLVIPITLAAATASWFLVEKPLIRRSHRRRAA